MPQGTRRFEVPLGGNKGFGGIILLKIREDLEL